ncbi:hypothetical protein MHM98_15880 [Psychrobium sp. MM17-31]|uniref:hypothetical protein n=1 Tax=Psychrobium sp. MM17-31 TaxID=2917758 RepID=UPI001EF4590F|nr:hypothetical protein [Psychrobium sp. MM17-31]MCG7532811.1 hypothetical protein [Psychrobium sp. MM17-31]
MNQLTHSFSPDIEQKFVQRNAVLSCAIGLLFGGGVAYQYLKAINASGVAAIFIAAVFLIMLIALVRLVISLPTPQHFFWNGNCRDEYLNHLSHKATKYSANTAIAVGVLLIMSAENLVLTGAETASIIVSLVSLAYGVPLLFWLRGDNNDE